jgi:hypothetical protein
MLAGNTNRGDVIDLNQRRARLPTRAENILAIPTELLSFERSCSEAERLKAGALRY